MSRFEFIVLAGGASTRFGVNNKLLQPICGKSVLDYVLDLTTNPILVASPDVAQNPISTRAAKVVIQSSPNGNAAAFLLGMEHVYDAHVLVLLGDCPLVQPDTIARIKQRIDAHDLIFGTFSDTQPNHYGRVQAKNDRYMVREQGEHPQPSEFYHAGWICFNARFLRTMPHINHAGCESYLTRYVELASNPHPLTVMPEEALGVNTFGQYQRIHRLVHDRLLTQLALQGVRFIAPDSVTVSHDTKIGLSTTVHPNVVFGPNVTLGKNVTVMPFSYLENIAVGDNCTIGPFAHIRGNTVLQSNVTVGSFCEVKNSVLQSGAKAKHVAYIGDADVGRNVNVGAGTVICNYDGTKKNRTTIEDGAFLGGNTTYVAPLTVGSNAYVGAGTVVRQDISGDTVVAASQKYVKYKRNRCEE